MCKVVNKRIHASSQLAFRRFECDSHGAWWELSPLYIKFSEKGAEQISKILGHEKPFRKPGKVITREQGMSIGIPLAPLNIQWIHSVRCPHGFPGVLLFEHGCDCQEDIQPR
ncbi:hypothetical protein CEXT_34861 [Caerostris extrusa]|uniref:Uncharacterized protein n=1 Tax=Caerostris extrusa TaxID=172846 RepID=A0AAV4VZF0_CAEEX|nr:hypothetical protein CEXT_34861 [Caerostris extrusa]